MIADPNVLASVVVVVSGVVRGGVLVGVARVAVVCGVVRGGVVSGIVRGGVGVVDDVHRLTVPSGFCKNGRYLGFVDCFEEGIPWFGFGECSIE